jgi:rhodanese-related sulfurtransferase
VNVNAKLTKTMPVEIVPHLWLGDSKDAEHVTPYTSLVVNCTHNIPFFGASVLRTNVRIPVDDLDDDHEQQIMLEHWTCSEVLKDMLNHMMQDHDVLVHCQMGRQRSAATVAAFLMTSGMSVDDAIKHIKSKKKEAFFPKANFEKALRNFAQTLVDRA